MSAVCARENFRAALDCCNPRVRMLDVDIASRSRAVVASTLLFASSLAAQVPSSRTKAADNVWIWSRGCLGGYELGVTVRLGSKVLQHAVLPICQGSRDAEDGRLRFRIAGSDLRLHGYDTGPSDSIEADIWQAGGEPDALILGFSLDAAGDSRVNTLHIAKPDRRVSSDLGRGLTLTTYPILRR